MEYSDSVKSISPAAINELATVSDKYTVNPCKDYSRIPKYFSVFFEKKHKNSADILTAIWQMRSSKFGLENVQCNYYNRDRFHYKRIQTQKPDADNDF